MQPNVPGQPAAYSMNTINIMRRNFIKTATLCASAALLSGGLLFAQSQPASKPKAKSDAPPPIVEAVPATPFDAPAGAWTLVALPDTQGYSMKYPKVYMRQTEWIVKNKKSHNILFVLHEGDIVDKNLDEQWRNARAAMSVLNKGGVPYALVPGNHDYDYKEPGRRTLLNKYFNDADYKSSEKHGLFEKGRMDNSWHTLATPWGPFLIFALEFGPRDEVLDWAGKIASARPDHRVIIVMHAYLYSDSTRYDKDKYGAAQRWSAKNYKLVQPGSVNDGEDIWQKLVSKHPNMRLVFCGHVLNNGTGYLASALPDGKIVHQILANYQGGVKPDRGYRGGGYLRLMQFLPDKKTVRIKSYSPLYDKWLTDADQQFEIKID